MDALEAIFTRRSIRKFQDKPVPDEMVRTMLAAAMSAPTADNAQPWQFIVITDRERLGAIPSIHAYAKMAAEAAVAIVVCGDTSLEIAPDYWLLDCSAAVQNVLLAAHALGLGAVWCGVYPGAERIERFRRFLELPDHVIPHTLIAIGHSAEQPGPVDRYREDRVHRDRWRGEAGGMSDEG